MNNAGPTEKNKHDKYICYVLMNKIWYFRDIV